MDMTESIAPKSDQMNAEDLLSGPRTFTITEVRGGSPDQPVSVFVAEHPQPFKPSKTVRRLMVFAWGPESDAYIGQRMTLYRDPEVRFGGQDIGGIRVSHMSGIRKRIEVALAVTRGKRGMYTVEPLPDAPASIAVPLTLAVRAENAVTVWATKGVTEQQLEVHTGKARAHWTERTLGELVELWQSIGRGEAIQAEVFPSAAPAPEPEGPPPAGQAEPPRDPAEPSDEEWARMQDGQNA